MTNGNCKKNINNLYIVSDKYNLYGAKFWLGDWNFVCVCIV